MSYLSEWADTRFSTSELLQEAVVAYANVLRDEAVAALAATEVDNLEMSYLTARARFRIGDLTATDVAQATARLALARADRSDAQAILARSKEEYIAVIGDAPTKLQPPSFAYTFPADERDAMKIALARNDALDAVRYRIRAAASRVQAAKSEREPKVYATSAVRYFNYLDSITADLPFPPRLEGTAIDVGVTLEIPLYQGGAPAALVRQATGEMMSRMEEEIAIERAVVGWLRTIYATLRNLGVEAEQAALAIEANREAVRGTQLEHELGTRTLLDLLDAKKELAQSQIIALTIERDRIVAEFVLAAALGNASPIELGLVDTADTKFTGLPPLEVAGATGPTARNFSPCKAPERSISGPMTETSW